MKPTAILGAVFAMVVGLAPAARAQQFTLTVSPQSFTFPSADPDLRGEIPADTAIDVGYKAAGMGKNGEWHLSVRASGELDSGSATISVGNIRWTADPPLASGPALSSTSDFTLLTGTGNMTAIRHSLVTFYLLNQWTYKAGNYTTTIIFTLSSP